MRVSFEMKTRHRRALLALASSRGEKGLSSVLADAIDHYLRRESARPLRRSELVLIAGSISNKEAKSLRRVTKAVRENWR
jgi:hypothetical protein